MSYPDLHYFSHTLSISSTMVQTNELTFYIVYLEYCKKKKESALKNLQYQDPREALKYQMCIVIVCHLMQDTHLPGPMMLTLQRAAGHGEENYFYTSLITAASLWYSAKPPAALNNNVIKFSCSITKMLHRGLCINGSMVPSCPIWFNTLPTIGGNM